MRGKIRGRLWTSRREQEVGNAFGLARESEPALRELALLLESAGRLVDELTVELGEP